MASNSGWTTGLPSGQSTVEQTDDEFRSLKSYVEAWTETEHYATGGSANSAGVHRVGSARVYQGTTSQLSNPTGDGSHRLFHATDDGGLYVSNPSTSSWTLLTNGITLGSANSWTALQEFTSDVSTSDVVVGGVVGGVASITSVVATTEGIANGGNTLFQVSATQNQFVHGDFFLPSITSLLGTGSIPAVRLHASLQGSNASQLIVYITNDSGSRVTLSSGETVTVLGFKNPLAS